MKHTKTLFILALMVAVLAGIYSGIGLFSSGGPGNFMFTTLRGDSVKMYGQGIYQFDTAFRAPIFRGTDAITLFVAIPTLLIGAVISLRGRLRSRIFVTSMLAYFLYNSASLAFGAAYNNLLLVYIVCASLSLFGFVMGFQSIDIDRLGRSTSNKLPRMPIALFLFLAASSLLVWVIDIVSALINGTIPQGLGPYTTEATYSLDLGVILPAAVLAGVLVLRRKALGTLLASILITLNVSIGFVVASQSIMQALDGIILKPGEYAAYVAPFVGLSVIAIIMIVTIYRAISEP